MTATSATPTQVPAPKGQVDTSQPSADAKPENIVDSPDDFQAALEAEVARRIEAVERRWQSRKDRELNRARRRWESEAGQAIDPELLSWIAEADPREVGQWLKSGLIDQKPAPSEPTDGNAPSASTTAASDDSTTPPTADPNSPSTDTASGSASASTAPARETDVTREHPPAPDPDTEREAQARDQLAERRSQDPSPDLFPSRGAPADAFHQIEAGFARGEVDLETYETARRRRGLA